MKVGTKQIAGLACGSEGDAERMGQIHDVYPNRLVVLLLLKLTLAPALVAAASVVERRFGHRVAGWTAGFPIVAGPVLFFLAHEQGHTFTSIAAKQTLLGLVSLSAYCVAYGWISRRAAPMPTLLLSYIAFAAGTLLMSKAALSLLPALLTAALSLTLGRLLLPLPAAATGPTPRPSLWVRMIATAAIVLTVTGLAHILGPRWSGLLVPFPIASTVLVVAAHGAAGSDGALRVLRGLLPGLYGFALFCASVSHWLPAHGLLIAFAIGIAASLVSQTLALRLR